MNKKSTLKLNRKTVILAFEWCKNKWGESKFQDNFPKIVCHKNISEDKLYGYFDETNNEIHIFLQPHKSILNLIKTVIHEYTHYKQNIAKNYDKYATRSKFYYDNPYERSAENKANKWAIVCKRNLVIELSSK
jgi:hypothetical protein